MNSINKRTLATKITILCTTLSAGMLYSSERIITENTESRPVIAIWPEGTADINPGIPEKVKPCGKRYFNIYNPNITVYAPDEPIGTAIILCPGGGYKYITAGIEGKETAEKLNQSGITVFVLKYRLPGTAGVDFTHPVPLSDALRAIQFVRFHAAELNIDPNKIGILGFSAGGHLASAAGTLYSKYHFGSDSISRVSSRPDFMGLVYPVISTKQGLTHRCLQYLIKDKSGKQMRILSNDLNVTEQTPPAFIVHAKDDSSVKYQSSILMYDALIKHHVSAVLRLYEKGGHGFSTGREGTDSVAWNEEFVTWLHQMKFIQMLNK